MPDKNCPRCSAPLAGTVSHQCSAAEPTIKATTPPSPSAGRSASPSVSRRPEETPAEVARLQGDPANVVQQYVLVQKLGQGGMGQVWRAWDTKLTRWVAIKFLTLADEGSVKRFEREAKLAARLRHPNIAAIYEIGQDKDRPYIAMEFVDGVSLGKANMTLQETIEVAAKLARALEEAHRAGVIHRDLKPENLMVSQGGRPYVMDFGLAKSVETESSLSVSGDVMGTPIFMSPEQARGEIDALDARTDVYSLGATLYTLLTGQRPFTGKTTVEILMKVVNQEPPSPRKIKPEIPEPVEAIIVKSMEKDRNRRYGTALAMAEDLERFLANLDVEARLPSLSSLIVRRIRRNAWPAAMGFVLLLALAIGIVTWAARPGESGWMKDFQRDRQALEYASFKPKDERLPGLKALLAERTLAPDDEKEVFDWFRVQLDVAEKDVRPWSGRPHSEWPDLRESALRAKAWCDALVDVLNDAKALAPKIAAIRELAGALLAWRGDFTLKVSVLPSIVRDLRRAGKSVSLKDPVSPVVLELEIDDYEIDLGNPAADGVAETVPLPASKLRPGMTVFIVGDLKKKGTVRASP